MGVYPIHYNHDVTGHPNSYINSKEIKNQIMFVILERIENLMIFIEVLGYIAIALMVLQILLKIGMVTCNSYKSTQDQPGKTNNSSPDSSSKKYESFYASSHESSNRNELLTASSSRESYV